MLCYLYKVQLAILIVTIQISLSLSLSLCLSSSFTKCALFCNVVSQSQQYKIGKIFYKGIFSSSKRLSQSVICCLFWLLLTTMLYYLFFLNLLSKSQKEKFVKDTRRKRYVFDQKVHMEYLEKVIKKISLVFL